MDVPERTYDRDIAKTISREVDSKLLKISISAHPDKEPKELEQIKKLAAAVLMRAARDIIESIDIEDTNEWLSDREPDTPFSLYWIADLLGIDRELLFRKFQNIVIQARGVH